MTKRKKSELLSALYKKILNDKNLPLRTDRLKNGYKLVFGEGNENSKIIFIGEAPGKNEALSGKPFCGVSGKVLDTLLESINISRKDIYITNIVKDRPPMNRDPMPSEIDAYAKYLDNQIDIIKPKAIVTLGRLPMKYIMERFGLPDEIKSISHIHGYSFNVRASYSPIKIVTLYHPAVAVYNRKMLKILSEDFKVLNSLK